MVIRHEKIFIASLGLVVLISSSLPASAHRTQERRMFPTNRGRREPSGLQRRWKRRFPSIRENGILRGEPENDKEDKGGSGKNKKERGRTNRQRTSPLFTLASTCVKSWWSVGVDKGHWIAVRPGLRHAFSRGGR